MLRRISLPLLRGLPQPQPALRTALSISQSRYYAKAGKPPSYQQPSFQRKSPSNPAGPQRSPNAVPTGEDDITASATLNSTQSSPEDQRTGSKAQSASEQPSDSSAADSEPQQPLPDLTKGIPSTLDADQVLRKLDPFMMIRWPLFREATLYKDGGYVKDLSYLNRDLKKVVIMDTDAHHVKNQPENAIIIPKWTGDPNDQTLIQMIPFLEYLATMGFDDARSVLKSFEGKYIPAEFARREKLLREKFEAERKGKGKPKKSLGLGSLFKQQSPDGIPSTEDAMAEGKMYWDIMRERGQRNYMELEKNIREEGAKFLAEREAEEKRMQEDAAKNLRSGGFLPGWLGGGQKDEAEKK